MKRILSILLACLLVSCMLPAMAEAESELTTIRVVSYDKSVTFAGNTYYLSDILSGKVQSTRYDLYVQKLAERGLQIEYDIVTDDQYSTYLNTQLATSGGIDADIFCIMPLDNATRLSMAQDGYFLAMDELYPYSDGTIQNYFENGYGSILTALESIDDHLYWCSNLTVGDYEGEPTGSYMLYFVRQDWLEKLNMETPTTLDELYDFVIACRENDVNGTGVVDEMINFAAGGNAASAWFGVSDTWFYLNANGQFTTPYHTDGFKDYLQFLKKLNDVGALEFTEVADTLEKENKLIGKQNWASRNVTFSVSDDQPTPVYVPVMIKPYEDQPTYIIQESAYSVATRSFAINAKTDKLEAIATLLDFSLGDEYILLAESYHPELEGLTWKYDAETDSYIAPDPIEDNWDNLAAVNSKTSGLWGNTLMHRYTLTDRKNEIAYKYHDVNKAFMETEYGYGYQYTLMKGSSSALLSFPTEEEAETVADYTTDLETYMEELAIKLVLGEKSFDDWDSYMKDLEKLGVSKVLEVYQTRYDRAQEALAE